jgi:DNA-binding sugar fermentation-stimulating protein
MHNDFDCVRTGHYRNRNEFFGETIRAHFLNRPNRFLIHCEMESQTLSAFLPNPGRLQELFRQRL